MLKESKVLLADEPTGNLDKNNSIEIIKILKEIASDKLVIIVSHNEELVKEYADGIIHLEDGKIIRNTVKKDEEKNIHYEKELKSCIKNRVALKMAWHNFGLRKMKFVIYLLTMIVAYTALSVCFSFIQYNRSDPHYKLIKSQEYNVYNVASVDKYAFEYLQTQEDFKFIRKPYASSKQQLLNMGFEFYRREADFTKGCAYVSEAYLEYLYEKRRKDIYTLDGEEIKLDYKTLNFVELICHKFTREYDGLKEEYVISGIYMTPDRKRAETIMHDQYYKYYENKLFGIDYIMYAEGTNVRSDIDERFETTMFFNGFDRNVTNHKGIIDGNNGVIVTKDDMIEYNADDDLTATLNENEIYITFGLYTQLNERWYYPSYFVGVERYRLDGEECYHYRGVRMPDIIGKKINIKTTNTKQNETVEYHELTIKGVLFDDYIFTSNNDEHVIGTVLPEPISTEYHEFTDIKNLWMRVDNIDNLYGVMKTLANQHGVSFESPATRVETSFQEFINIAKLVSLIFVFVFTSVVVLITISTVGYQVYDRKKEIGILKSLGAKNGEIKKIFLYEVIFMIVVMSIISLFGAYGLITVTNKMLLLKRSFVEDYILIYYKIYNIPLLILVITTLSIAATLIPLSKINKMSVVEAIRK